MFAIFMIEVVLVKLDCLLESCGVSISDLLPSKLTILQFSFARQ